MKFEYYIRAAWRQRKRKIICFFMNSSLFTSTLFSLHSIQDKIDFGPQNKKKLSAIHFSPQFDSLLHNHMVSSIIQEFLFLSDFTLE